MTTSKQITVTVSDLSPRMLDAVVEDLKDAIKEFIEDEELGGHFTVVVI